MTKAAIVRAIDAEICWAHEPDRRVILRRDQAPSAIRGLTVRQPWASLIADGLKTIEVRTHRVGYRGLLIIHAGKTAGGVRVRPAHQQGIGRHFRRCCGAQPSRLPARVHGGDRAG